MENLFFIATLFAFPSVGLLLHMLIPRGDLLRKHLMYLIGRLGNKGLSNQISGANDKVANDFIRWGILESNGNFDLTGIALIISLIEAKSSRDVASSLGANAAGALCFYQDIIANAAIGESNDTEDINRFAVLLKQFLEQEEGTPASSATRSVNYANAETSSSVSLSNLANAVHSLASRPSNDFEKNWVYLKLRDTVTLFPQPDPQQARILWKIEGKDEHLSIVTSFNAIFGIYLGSRTCRVSLFSADTRKQLLIDYAKRLEESLANIPNPCGAFRNILYPTLTGRRTLTVSWTIPIDQKTTPEYILNFANEVWKGLSCALELVDSPSSYLVNNLSPNNNTDRMNYLVIEVKDNQIERRYGYHPGNTPGEAIAAATVNLGIQPEGANRPNRAWLVRSIYLVPQKVFTSIKTSEDARFNEGAISSGAGFYYVNCRKSVGRSSVETSLYQRMRVYPDVTWHKEPQGLMGQGGGVGYVGYAKFNAMADAQAYLQDMAFIVTDLSPIKNHTLQ